MAEPLTVVTAADAGYVLPLAVMLRSMLEHLAPDVSPDVFVVDDGIGPELRNRVERSLPERLALHWIEPPAAERQGLPLWGRMSATTYCKFLIPRILPAGRTRALWLDADLLVLADLTELWRQDLGGHSVLAVADPFVPSLSSPLGVAGYEDLGLPRDAAYFNAGVMLLDVARWRRENVPALADRYLRRFRDRVFFYDQEALNAVLVGAWGPLDGRWNRSVSGVLLGRVEDHSAAAILHYSGTLKPWRYRGRGRYHEIYYSYVDRTAWRSFRPPRSAWGALVGLYQASGLRRNLHPLEQRCFQSYAEWSRRVVGGDRG